MKRRGWLILLIILGLVIAALSGGAWLPPLLSFISQNSDTIQGLTDFIQLLLWLGAAGVAFVGFWRRAPSPPISVPPPSQREAPSHPLATGERAVVFQDTAQGNITITGDGNEINLAEPTVKPEPPVLRRAYLNRVLEQTGNLSLSGIDPKTASEAEARLSLSAIYTALLTQNVAQEKGEERLALEGREARRLSALEQLNRHARLVLLGDPGSGKSTFVNFVTLCLVGEALGHPDIHLTLLTAPLPPTREQQRKEETPAPQAWDHHALLPVRIVLRDFAARGLPPVNLPAGAKHFWAFLEAELDSAGLRDFLPHLRKEIHEKGGLVLFDGLDEVPEAGARRVQIKQVVEDFARTCPKCRLLVTSRTYAYQKQDWRLPGFAETELAPFTDPQIELFAERWYAHIAGLRHLNPEEAKGRAETLKRVILTNERLHSLAERPLLLTLMASLHAWRGGTLPDKREQLYADTVELLLDWWETPKTPRDAQGNFIDPQPSLAEWLKVDRQQVRALLNRLAYQAHAQQPELAGTADVPEDALIAGLLALSNNPDVKPKRLVEYLSQRAGLLLPRGEQVYTFPHRTFQEYLAACHLTDENFPEEIANLARQAPERWREVALLAGAKAARGAASNIWMLADALCYCDPDAPESGPPDVWGAHLAGQALAETANLNQVSARNRPRLEKVQHWLVSILQKNALPALERARAGETLATLGDPRFDPDFYHLPKEPLLGFVEIPAGPFVMGSDPKTDKQTYEERETPQHTLELPTYWLARYPVTVAQFRAYVEETGCKPEVRDSLNGLANHPVVYVTWHEAMKYCTWLNDKLKDSALQRVGDSGGTQRAFWEGVASGKLRVTLPSEAEWEKAARGGLQNPTSSHEFPQIYPWPDPFSPDHANTRETGLNTTSAVGCFPLGASPYGLLDMSGNVWEWTRSIFGKWDGKKSKHVALFRYPYLANDGRENLQADNDYSRVLRGGSFYDTQDLARCAYRFRDSPHNWRGGSGFRVVVSPTS